MSKYKVEITGDNSIEQVNLQIAGEEAGASEFMQSKVEIRNGEATNIVTFKELSAGTFPNELKIIPQNAPQPSGTDDAWSGVMVVDGTSTAVVAYRVL